ncbi:MAG: hypothetical protein IAE85_00440 [Anaerolinea sp.]|nr:hypothetical protein [Anaerolinea sp.]
MLAKEDEKGRIREAISLLTEAIQLADDPDYRLFRASLYYSLKEKQSALKDVEHLLATAGNNQDQYLEARKLKDEIETLPEGGCFIATAVYETPYSPELTVLRNFRDQVLLDSSVGKAVISCYYMISPSIARQLSKSRRAKLVVRVALLDPFVALLNRNRRNDHG